MHLKQSNPKDLNLQNPSAPNSGAHIKHEGAEDSYIKFCKHSLSALGMLEFHLEVQDKPASYLFSLLFDWAS